MVATNGGDALGTGPVTGMGAGVGAGWGWLMVAGIVAVVVGVLALFNPFPATYAATLVVGALLMALGVSALAAGIVGRGRRHGHGRETYLLLLGAVSLLVGLSLAFFPLSGAITLTIVVAAWLAARGVLELLAAGRLRRGRGIMVVLGIVNLILAAMIVFGIPFTALALPGTLLGISLLLGGIGEIRAAAAHRAGAPAFGR